MIPPEVRRRAEEAVAALEVALRVCADDPSDLATAALGAAVTEGYRAKAQLAEFTPTSEETA